MKTNKFKVEFVDKIPSNLKDGILYVCISCNVIVHRCACGCGEKTVTPIDKKYGWVMKYDGQAITLRPSIGNFSIACRSHYYITDNNGWKDINKKIIKRDYLNELSSYSKNEMI